MKKKEISQRLDEHAGKLSALEGNNELTKKVALDSIVFAYFGLVAAVIAIIIGAINIRGIKSIRSQHDLIIVDTNGQISNDRPNYAVVIDENGQVSAVYQKVELEKILKSASKRFKCSIDYTYTAKDDYEACIYLKRGLKKNPHGYLHFYRRPSVSIASASFSVVKEEDDERKYLMQESYQYIESLETDDNGADKTIYRRVNLNSFEPEPPVTEFVVVVVGDYSFLLSQEEYEALEKAIGLIA